MTFFQSASNPRLQRLIAIFWLLALGLGVLHLGGDFYEIIYPDTIAYLDMADAFWRADWTMAINAYWSPFYPWLLAVAMLVPQPELYGDFAVVRLVDFAIYVGALGCFHCFVSESIRYRRSKVVEGSRDHSVMLPEWALLVLGYTLFIWTAVEWIPISVGAPDMCVAAFVYLAAAMLLRMRSECRSRLTPVLLGVVLGCGYLSKAAIFPLAFIFLGCSIFSGHKVRSGVLRGVTALSAFLLIASPWIAALSQAKGGVTFGLSGKLNYAWHVNGVTRFIHWQGEPPGSGIPKHPTRRIFDVPAVYEFGSPIRGTYPPWYDPTYWYEGLGLHFDLKEQIGAVVRNVRTYFEIAPVAQGGVIAGFLHLCMQASTPWLSMKRIANEWQVLTPAMAALGMYSLLNMESRYVAPFVVLFGMGLAFSVRLADNPGSRRLLACIIWAMLLPIMVTVAAATAETAYLGLRYSIRKDSPAHRQWQVTEALKSMGIQPGDRVASIGRAFDADWARLARVRIVAEIPRREEDKFWAATDAVRSEVLTTVAKTGAQLIVADRVPSYASTSGWQEIVNTGHYVYVLSALGEVEKKPHS